MKNNRTLFPYSLTILVLLFLLPTIASAQQETVNRIYDFSGNTDTLNSQINFVYADSNRIIAMGEAYPENEEPRAFVAAFDYAGNRLWQKPILLPDGLINLADGFDNLKKVKPNLYVALGNIPNVPKTNGILSYEPFLYFFNTQGDSLKLVRFPSDSTILQRMTALTTDKEDNVIVGGVISPLDTPQNEVYIRRYWFAKFNDAGIFLQQDTFRIVNYQVYYWAPNPEVTYITPVSWDSIHYLATANNYGTFGPKSIFNGGIILNIGQDLAIKRFYDIRYGHPPESQLADWLTLACDTKPFDFNFIKRMEGKYSFYWSLPVGEIIQPFTYDTIGIYYAKA